MPKAQGAKRRLKGTIHNMVSPPYWYMVTVFKHRKTEYVVKEELDDVIHNLKLRLPTLVVQFVAYEITGKYAQLHFHGIAHTSRKVFFKKNNSLLGFRVQWSPIRQTSGRHIVQEGEYIYQPSEMEKAIAYIRKDIGNKYAQEQAFVENDLTNGPYAFI